MIAEGRDPAAKVEAREAELHTVAAGGRGSSISWTAAETTGRGLLLKPKRLSK